MLARKQLFIIPFFKEVNSREAFFFGLVLSRIFFWGPKMKWESNFLRHVELLSCCIAFLDCTIINTPTETAPRILNFGVLSVKVYVIKSSNSICLLILPTGVLSLFGTEGPVLTKSKKP